MYKFALAGLVAVVTVLAAGCGGDDDTGTPVTSGVPTSAQAAASPSPSAASTATTAGRSTSSRFYPKVTVQADGWQVEEDVINAFELEYDGPDGRASLWFLRTDEVFDPATGDAVDAPADLAVFFREHPNLTVVAEESVTIGGLTGTQIDVTTSAPDDFNVLAQPQGPVGFLANDAARLIVLDSAAGQFLVLIGHPNNPGLFQSAVSIAEPVLATVQFD
jgi:hypothetical protein